MAVVAVDEITPEFQRITEYLSKNTVADLIVIALEFVYEMVWRPRQDSNLRPAA